MVNCLFFPFFYGSLEMYQSFSTVRGHNELCRAEPEERLFVLLIDLEPRFTWMYYMTSWIYIEFIF